MKKTLLISSVALGLLAQSALATVSFTATPLSQSVGAGGLFNVTFGLTVTGGAGDPANIAAFDLYIATAAANSGLFSITSATGIAPYTSTGPGAVFPDSISTAAASGFVRNGANMGFSATSVQSVPQTNQSLETLQFSVSNSAAPGTYNFSTTTTLNAGQFFSDVSDSPNGNVFEGQPATFSITVVPEPSTWAMGVLGVGVIGYVMLRRRRVA